MLYIFSLSTLSDHNLCTKFLPQKCFSYNVLLHDNAMVLLTHFVLMDYISDFLGL